VDWVEDAEPVLDALRADSAALLGISAGGPFAAACAPGIPGRVRSLMLVSPLGPPGWPTRGMASGERLSLGVARHAPDDPDTSCADVTGQASAVAAGPFDADQAK